MWQSGMLDVIRKVTTMPKAKQRKTRAKAKQKRMRATLKQGRTKTPHKKGKFIGCLEAVADEADVMKNPVSQGGEDLYPFPHIDPDYPLQKVILPNNIRVQTMCVPLSHGRWLAAQVQEGTAAVAETKERAEDAVRANVRRQNATHDFFESVSAAELARTQGVRPIRRVDQIRAFSAPDPAEADWFAREVRRWRREGLPARKVAR